MSFFALVAESVAALQESALDREYIASEEFSDFLENLTIRVANARAREKRERFRAVLLAAMQGHREPSFASVFMDILHEISEEERSVLAGFYHVSCAIASRR